MINTMQLTDTHCHIQESTYPSGGDDAYQRALDASVTRMICVGTDAKSSQEAVAFAATHAQAWASIGLHPHDAKDAGNAIDLFEHFIVQPKVVAVGECGLDYFYSHSPKDAQETMLRAQIELALTYDKPLIFHVREAFDDFWPIFDEYEGIRGVLHSFTDTKDNLERAVERGLYIGVNGISTFTKVNEQKEMFGSIPLSNLLVETDAPFLTPVPLRGTVNEPAYVTHVAKHLAMLQNISLTELAEATSSNANKLFTL